MPGRGRTGPTIVAMLAFVVAAGLGGGASASQSIDPCYNWCYILLNRGGVTSQECNRRCRASKRYVCDSRCVRKNPNSPRELRSCQSKCVGLPGPYSSIAPSGRLMMSAFPVTQPEGIARP